MVEIYIFVITYYMPLIHELLLFNYSVSCPLIYYSTSIIIIVIIIIIINIIVSLLLNKFLYYIQTDRLVSQLHTCTSQSEVINTVSYRSVIS